MQFSLFDIFYVGKFLDEFSLLFFYLENSTKWHNFSIEKRQQESIHQFKKA
jgi:hypothetical protein